MEKMYMHKKSGLRQCGIYTAAILFCLTVFAVPGTAWAQCENSVTATSEFSQLIRDIRTDLNDFIEQESNFINDDITETATDEMLERLEEFDTNIRNGLTEWWKDHFLPALKNMTAQLHSAGIDKTMTLGKVFDAQMLNEYSQALQQKEVDAQRMYQPNEMSCQADSVGPGQTKAARMARALNRTMEKDSTARRLNVRGQPGAGGQGAGIRATWDEYTTLFCDPDKGGLGCGGTPGTMPGAHVDIPSILWGDRQTVDMTTVENQQLVDASLRFLIAPMPQDPIPPSVIDSPQGRQAMLARRAQAARTNAIYTVMGQMMAERAGGSGVDTADVRTAAGLPPAEASSDASYREILHAVSKDRFHNPEYVVRMIQSPEQVVREQGSVQALRLQQMNDLYKRMEEMVFMEAAVYSADLDSQMPTTHWTAMQMQ